MSALTFLGAFAENLTVTIQYGNAIPDKTVETTYTPGMSALDALRQVSRVETSQTGSYLFVRSIDGVRSQVGKFGWFYTVDGHTVHQTAQNYVLDHARTMTWSYKVEACY